MDVEQQAEMDAALEANKPVDQTIDAKTEQADEHPIEATTPVFPEPQHFPESLHNFAEEPANTGRSTPIVPAAPVYIQYVPVTQPATVSATTAPVPVPGTSAVPTDMPHVEHSYQPANFACVRCGSRNIARGYVVDYGDKFEQVHFAPKRISLNRLNSLLNLRPWRRLLKLDAEACRDCGAVMLVVDPEDLRRAERTRD